MADVSRVMEDIQTCGNNPSKALVTILELLDNEEFDRDSTAKCLQEQGILSELATMLKSCLSGHRVKLAQVIAELAKTEELRQPCVNEGVLPTLLGLLSLEDIPACTQSCRALGNICFDNDVARSEISERNGIQSLVDLMKRLLSHTADGASKLRQVTCGLLLNLTNTQGMRLTSCNVHRPYSSYKLMEPASPTEAENVRMITLRIKLDSNANQETIQEKAVGLGALQVLNDYLSQHSDDDSVVQMALCAVGSLTESDTGKQAVVSGPILGTIVHLIGTPVGDELQETILELLTNLAENDQVKLILAESDIGDRLLGLLQRSQTYTEDDSSQTEKMVSDLVVLILTGDGSMERLYSGGEGKLYQESLRWLESSSEQLRVSAALAIGNFARNDTQCIRLVRDGITEKLLCLLQDTSRSEASEPTLQHAVFSALRNLAIPAPNKPLMLSCGMIPLLLQHITSEFSSVQFKLLGTLRMVIDGQEEAAKSLGTNEDFVEKLVNWCGVEGHAGVKGEASRLSAGLVKHSRSRDVMDALCTQGILPHLVNMLNSEFTLMQNEALMALTLTASTVLGNHTQRFVDAEMVPGVKVLLTDKDTVPEILCNTLTLVKLLAQSDEMLQLMKAAELSLAVDSLQRHSESNVSKAAKDVLTLLSKG